MPDPKTIRLTDFTQGIQTTDRLDYAPNAVRAGSNVTLAETIQTRGGLSTVDSVGLPAGSEIMSLAQVKFPTNEKTYLVAQVYNPPAETPQDFESTEEDYVSTGDFVQIQNNTPIKIGGFGTGDTTVTLTDFQVYMDTTRIMNLVMTETGVTDSRQGDATVTGTYGDIWNTTGIILSTDAYLTFASQVTNDWFRDFRSATTITYKFKLQFDFGVESFAQFTSRMFSTKDNNYYYLYFNIDGSEAAAAADTQVLVNESGELVSGVMFDPSLITDGSTWAFTLSYTITDEEYYQYNDWSLTIGEDYTDTPAPASWSLYAMPDTLPDTGA